jgi:uncharacterized protein YtpQ (UPF0354 family)
LEAPGIASPQVTWYSFLKLSNKEITVSAIHCVGDMYPRIHANELTGSHFGFCLSNDGSALIQALA